MRSPMVIPKPLWFEPERGSPESNGEPPCIHVAAELAEYHGAQTVALLSLGMWTGELVRRYRGDVLGAMHAVAIDTQTDAVYGNALSAGAAPPADVSQELVGVEEWFNVDLRSHLGLPARPGVYDVFVWGDAVVSRVLRVLMPAPDGALPPGQDSAVDSPSFAVAQSAQGDTVLRVTVGTGAARPVVVLASSGPDCAFALFRESGFFDPRTVVEEKHGFAVAYCAGRITPVISF